MASPLLRLTLRQGSVYYIQHRDVTSPEPHFLVVVNPDPLNDTVLVFGVVTSKVESRRKQIQLAGLPIETLVTISPSQYSELYMESAIDCNHPKTLTINELDNKILTATKSCIDMHGDICQQILNGIKASPVVGDPIKKILGML